MRRGWKLAAKGAVSATLLTLIVWKVGAARILSSLRGLDAAFALPALLIGFLLVLLKAARWRIVARAESRALSLGAATRSLLVGYGFGMLTPGRLGEFARIFNIPGDRYRLAGLTLVDKVFDFIILLLFVAVLLSVYASPAVAIPIAFATFAGVLLLYFPRRAAALLNRILFRLPLGEKIARAVESASALTAGTVTAALLLTALSFVLEMGQFYLLLLAFEPATLKGIVIALPFLVLSNLLPITIGGLGIREGVTAVILSRFHVSEAAAVSTAFIMFVIDTLLPGLVGALLAHAVVGPEKETAA